MLTDNLFDKVLLYPLELGANQLYIVSGYATAAMAFNHLQKIRTEKKNLSVKLIIGMSGVDGLSESNHRGFRKIVQDDFKGEFECNYVKSLPSIHSKVYSWYRDDHPVKGFLGSANYTQIAFQRLTRKEVMAESSAQEGLAYFQSLMSQTISCTDVNADSLVAIYNERQYKATPKSKKQSGVQDVVPIIPTHMNQELQHIKVSLLVRGGDTPTKSGLNWGQRDNREPNQAYLSLKADVYNSDFFPERPIRFTVQTDDKQVLICTRAQDNGKAIHTPQNNSLIGEYFRNRLGLDLGVYVTKEDLEAYGRTDVDFYKIDDETYFMDFSV